MNNIIQIENLNKSFNLLDSKSLTIINNLSFSVKKNCIISIIGPSGSGKSTFLNILGFLDSNYSGNFLFQGEDVKNINSGKLNKLRGKSIGFIHQFFHLIPELTVLENVMLPSLIINNNIKDSQSEALKFLNIFGLEDRLNFKPKKLSGGEQQRVAISRALINNPEIILADEMTGNLDEETADQIFRFFLNYIIKNKKSFIFVTHNKKFSIMANEQYYFKDKKLIKNET